MVLKLDMRKAYDKIEWLFLEAVMMKTGFASKWVELIMKCVSIVSYSLLINLNIPKVLDRVILSHPISLFSVMKFLVIFLTKLKWQVKLFEFL